MLDTDEEAIALSARDAAELAGITYRQLDYWDRIGIIGPSIAEARGSGSRRRYSLQDVRVLACLAQLCQLGAPISQLGELVAELGLVQSWSGPLYVSRSGMVGRSLEILDGPAGLVLDLARLAEAIEAKLDAALPEELRP